MEVTCERCKAEYDFDDSLVGESGTSVKCTDCGHVFKVFPAGSGAGRGRLQLRFRDGHVELLSSLRELQRRARDGEISLDDEIGREGFEWRPLRSVPELRGFFEPDSRPPGPAGATKPLGGGRLAVTPSLRPGGSRSSTPPPSAEAKRTMLGLGPAGGRPPARAPGEPSATPVGPPRARVPQAPQPAPAPERAAAGGPKPPAGDATAPKAAKPPPARAPSPSQPTPKLYLADDDERETPAKRRSAGGGSLRWIGLAVLVAGGVWFGINAMSGGLSGDSTVAGAVGDGAADTVDHPDASAAAVGDGATEAATSPAVEPLPNGQAPKAKPQAEKPAEDEARKKRNPKDEDRAGTRATRAKSGSETGSRRRRHRAEDDEEEDDSNAGYGTLVGRAGRHLDRKQYEKAEALLKRALEQRRSGSEANSAMGFALLGQGRASQAVQYFETAARNGFAAANVGLGDAYAKMGRNSAAIEAYQAYLRRMPSGSRAAYARSRMKALGPQSGGGRGGGAAAPKEEAPAPEENAPPPEEKSPAPSPPAEEPQPEDEGDDGYVPAGAALEDSP